MKRCPWCREALDRKASELKNCPHCGRELRKGEGGELRALDLRYETVEAELGIRLRKALTAGTPVAALSGFLLPFSHVAVVFVIPAMLLAHLLVIRIYLQGPARPYFGPGRSFVTRWMTRLTFIWIAGPAISLAVLPILGGFIAAASYAGINWAVVAYEKRNLRRERDELPMAGWERLVLFGLFLMTSVLILFVLGLGLLLGWSVHALLGWLNLN